MLKIRAGEPYLDVLKKLSGTKASGCFYTIIGTTSLLLRPTQHEKLDRVFESHEIQFCEQTAEEFLAAMRSKLTGLQYSAEISPFADERTLNLLRGEIDHGDDDLENRNQTAVIRPDGGVSVFRKLSERNSLWQMKGTFGFDEVGRAEARYVLQEELAALFQHATGCNWDCGEISWYVLTELQDATHAEFNSSLQKIPKVRPPLSGLLSRGMLPILIFTIYTGLPFPQVDGDGEGLTEVLDVENDEQDEIESVDSKWDGAPPNKLPRHVIAMVHGRRFDFHLLDDGSYLKSQRDIIRNEWSQFRVDLEKRLEREIVLIPSVLERATAEQIEQFEFELSDPRVVNPNPEIVTTLHGQVLLEFRILPEGSYHAVAYSVTLEQRHRLIERFKVALDARAEEFDNEVEVRHVRTPPREGDDNLPTGEYARALATLTSAPLNKLLQSGEVTFHDWWKLVAKLYAISTANTAKDLIHETIDLQVVAFKALCSLIEDRQFLDTLSDAATTLNLDSKTGVRLNVERLSNLAPVLTSAEWEMMKLASAQREEAVRDIEMTQRFNECCQAIPDLKSKQQATPRQLTQYFAKKHKAASVHLKRTEGEVLDDDDKRKIVNLVEAFKAIGGTVTYDGNACTVTLQKNKGMKQHRFLVRSVGRKQETLWSNVKVPALVFKK